MSLPTPFVLLVLAVGPLAAQVAKPVRFVAEWHGDRSRLVDATMGIVTSQADWEWLWRRHAGPKSTAPDVDFTANRVVAWFQGERDGGGRERFLNAEIKAGCLTLRLGPSPAPAPGPGPCHPYSMVVVPRAPERVAVAGPGAWMEYPVLARPAGDVEESWLGPCAKVDRAEVLRVIDAAAWAATWARARPGTVAPEVDWGAWMVIAVFLPRVSGRLSASPFVADEATKRLTLVLTDSSGPALQGPAPVYAFWLVRGRDAAIDVQLGTSSFDHREVTRTPPVKIAALSAIAKYGK